MKIEKGISIPKAFRGRKGKWDKLADQLEVGDSIFFTTEREFNNARNMLANRGIKITTRRIEGGFRIWRVEKPEGEMNALGS